MEVALEEVRAGGVLQGGGFALRAITDMTRVEYRFWQLWQLGIWSAIIFPVRRRDMSTFRFERLREWTESVGGPWEASPDPKGPHRYRLLYAGGRVLYCQDWRSHSSAFVDIARPEDELVLRGFGTSPGYIRKATESQSGMRLAPVHNFDGLLAWCGEQAPVRPIQEFHGWR